MRREADRQLITCPLPYGPPPYASCTQPYHPSSSRPSTCREPPSLPSVSSRRSSSQSYHPSVSYEHRLSRSRRRSVTRRPPTVELLGNDNVEDLAGRGDAMDGTEGDGRVYHLNSAVMLLGAVLLLVLLIVFGRLYFEPIPASH